METKSRPNHHPAIYRTGETLSRMADSGIWYATVQLSKEVEVGAYIFNELLMIA